MVDQFKRPVIVVGMHRSGTSLVSNILHQSGINMGVDQEHNGESKPFLHVNQEVLRKRGYDWLSVEQDEFSCPYSAEELYGYHLHLNSNYLKYGYLSRLLLFFHGRRWGFKDPRICFTLPMWLKLYPKAVVIFVTRRPEAVVDSLMRRNKVEGEVYDERLNDVSFCQNLWKRYNQAALYHLSNIQSNRLFKLRYEDLVADSSIKQQLAEFLNVSLANVEIHPDQGQSISLNWEEEDKQLLKLLGY